MTHYPIPEDFHAAVKLGVILAAILLTVLPEFAREFAEYRMLIFGLAMVLVMLYKPRGFVGTREPSDFLHAERKAISGKFTKEGHG